MSEKQVSFWQTATNVEKIINSILTLILNLKGQLIPNHPSAIYLVFPPNEPKKADLYFSPQAKLQQEADILLRRIELPEGILINELLGLASVRLNQLLQVYYSPSRSIYLLETEYREGGLMINMIRKG
ncbi:MAG: hypothetical protein NTZ49_05060 [Candidatus Parcubacteria bacterium]|nr:hypothetical protein [Candidatus Parcubacteria bacterium]